jgi:hypothetical protein
MMHPTLLAITALDLARERAQQGERHARLLGDRPARPAPTGGARPMLARVATAVSAAAAALASRLDEHPECASGDPTGRRSPV